VQRRCDLVLLLEHNAPTSRELRGKEFGVTRV
jgi:hypothetical protein